MKIHKLKLTLEGCAVAASLSTMLLNCPGKTFPLPSQNKNVDQAAATANLRAVAAASPDPDVWLGLSLLPQPGDPVRSELSAKAAAAKPELAVVAVVLAEGDLALDMN